jgi:hypothetical protein
MRVGRSDRQFAGINAIASVKFVLALSFVRPWPVDLADEEILERLVALNHEWADEKRRGLVRWLRPEFQNPDGRYVAV